MFENGVQNTADVCGYQLNDAGRIEVYCIEPSTNGSQTATYSMKCGASAVQSGIIENCLTDVASALVKNTYCVESGSDGEQLQDSYLVTDHQYQMAAGSENSDGLYRLEAGQTYQLDAANIEMNQASHEVNADAGTGSLVLQCVEYVEGGNTKCEGEDQMTNTFQAAAVASPVSEGSYEIVVLPNGTRALKKIKPANSRVSVKEIQVVKATDASELALSVGSSVMSSSVVADASQTVGGAETVVMAAETAAHAGSSYIILPSSLVSKSGLEGSSPTVVYQLADGPSIIQGK